MPVCLRGEAWEIFDSASVPAGWSAGGAGSNIQIVDTRAVRSGRSLEWTWTQPVATLTWNLPAPSTGAGHRVFSQWVRLEAPLSDARLRVELRSTNDQTRHFDMNLDFTGWRTVFVPYTSMTGGGTNSIDRIRWSLVGAPPPAGALYLDQIVVGQAMDVRFQFADVQVPFVWDGREKSHWENRVHWYRLRPPPAEPAADELADARQLRDYWDRYLTGSGPVTAAAVDQWEAKLNAFQVRREGDRVRGNTIFYQRYPEMSYPPSLAARLADEDGPNDFQRFTALMFEMARGWRRVSDETLRARLAEKLVLMAEHLLDQGWAAGSNQGCLTLYGYYAREYFRAVYLAREVFGHAGILEEMGEAARWYGQAGMLLDEECAPNMDFFNTLLQGQLLSILMEPDEAVQIAWLRAFADSIGHQIADTLPGDANGFKPDGTTFHHNGHYPAYGIGAISTIGGIFDAVRGTAFEFGTPARKAFRDVLLAARAYSHPLDWPIGISGRHPFSGGIGSAKQAFEAMAAYPDFNDGTSPDRAIAAAYSRLWGRPGGALGALFDDAGIKPENASGFFTFPFASHATYRHSDWMVSLKGYSRYVWSSEIYTADNRYGRYQSNGTAEILLASGRTGSGFREEGWDWNRLPGTTGVHLPLDDLENPRAGTLMLRSSETMAGGVSAGRDGAFGFILREDFFGHTLQARKSVFAADGFLIALGSGISSDHPAAPAETTLFQVALTGDHPPLIFNPPVGTISVFPWTGSLSPSTPFWVIDPVGNGYWLPAGQSLKFLRLTQESRHNKTKTATTGDFASGWIDHGQGAADGRYEYVILPQSSAAETAAFATRMAGPEPAYEVLRHENDLHAVRVAGPDRYGFAIYSPHEWEGLPHLISADKQSLLWIEETGEEIRVSIANPDLKPGETAGLVSPTGFLIRGLWEKVASQPDGTLYWHESGNTRIVVPAVEGASYHLRLAPAATARAWEETAVSNGMPRVENFQIAGSGPFFSWTFAPPHGEDHAFIVERLHPGSSEFVPVAFLDARTTEFFDPHLEERKIAYYRVRPWNASGVGEPTRSLLAFNPGSDRIFCDFRAISDVDELRERGWTESGIASEDDWYLDPRGMFLIDNSPSSPAAVTLPIKSRTNGRVTARMGVTRMANFHARIEVLAGNTTLGAIQMTTRTDGFLQGESDVTFTDESWDIAQSPPREVSIEWREIPSSDRMEVTLRYFGTTDSANAINRWEIVKSAGLPDQIRFSSGFGSSVDRGLVVESLEILTGASRSPGAFYRAWAEAYLGDGDAHPSADRNGNGVPDGWDFLWANETAHPRRAGHPAIVPQTIAVGGEERFAWEFPQVEGASFAIETSETPAGPWRTVAHTEEAVAGAPARVRLVTPAFESDERARFFRLILSADFLQP